MSSLSPSGYSQSSADSRDDMSMSPPLSVTLSPKSMNNLLNMTTDEQKANNIISMSTADTPYLRVVEQPVEKFRFRYKSEMMGTHGSLVGRSTDKSRKKYYPSVQLCNYDGPAMVRCSLFTAQQDLSLRAPHAHRLIIKVNNVEEDDPHHVEVNQTIGYDAVFQGMGIVHTAKKHINDELVNKKKARLLEQRRYDLNINKGQLSTTDIAQIKKEAAVEARHMNLNVVSLCFECFELLPNKEIGLLLCKPVFSSTISNMKSALTGELKICRIDKHVSSCRGHEEVFMFVEKVGKKNIKVKVYEADEEDMEVWSAFGQFSELDVHHQFGIVFRTPPYRDVNITSPVDVWLQLYRPSDGDFSEPVKFTYKPDARRKRQRTSSIYDDLETASSPVYNGLEGIIPQFLDNVLTLEVNSLVDVPATNNALMNGSDPMLQQQHQQQYDGDNLGQLSSIDTPSISELLNGDDKLLSADMKEFLENFPSTEYFGNMGSDMDLTTDGASGKPKLTARSKVSREKPIKSTLKTDDAVSPPTKPDSKTKTKSDDQNPADGLVPYLSETDGSISLRPIGELNAPFKIPSAKAWSGFSSPSGLRFEAQEPARRVEGTSKSVEGTATVKKTTVSEVLQTPVSEQQVSNESHVAKESQVDKESLVYKESQADKKSPVAKKSQVVNEALESNESPVTEDSPGAARSDLPTPVTPTTPPKVATNPEALVLRVTAKLTHMLTGKRSQDPPEVMANEVRDLFNGEKTDDGETALHLAILHEESDYRNVMLNALCTGQECFGKRGSLKDILDLRNDKDETAMHLAVLFNQPQTVRALLSGGANPNLANADGDYPLHIAVQQGHVACLAALVDKNSYQHTTKRLHVNVKNDDGWTALHLSALRRHLPSARLLCTGGADPNERDKSGGRSALHIAVEEQDVQMARFLVADARVDIDLQDRAGNTALHVAVVVGEKGSKELCDILLRARADPLVANFNTERRASSDVEPTIKLEPADEAEETTRLTALDLATENIELFQLFQHYEDNPLIVDVKKEEESDFHAAGGDQMFDSATLDRLCAILDQSSGWEKLATLLDCEFLVSGLRSKDVTSPTRALLNYTELKGKVGIDKIRDLLMILQEQKAVEVIDLMLARQLVAHTN